MRGPHKYVQEIPEHHAVQELSDGRLEFLELGTDVPHSVDHNYLVAMVFCFVLSSAFVGIRLYFMSITLSIAFSNQPT